MKNDKWADALNVISDEYLEEAAEPRRKQKLPWAGLLAGSLAAAMLTMILLPAGGLFLMFQGAGGAQPTTGSSPSDGATVIRAQVLSLAAEARNQDRFDKSTVFSQTEASSANRYDFFQKSSQLLLSGKEENVLWSPVNAWLNLAMTAQLADGETRQELLDALGAADMDALTAQASTLWEAVYIDEVAGKCLLANSVWIDTLCNFDRGAMDTLAHDFYASVYRAELGTEETNADIRNWVNENTGGFLQDATQNIEFPPNALLALYSTIYFQGRWDHEFSPAASSEDMFHTSEGEVTCTFMNKKASQMTYYWDKNFGAVSMAMRNGSSMWFILPDEGTPVDRVLADGDYLMLIADHNDPVTGEHTWRDQKQIKVNLSVPKFDISVQVELETMMQALGIENAFDPDSAEFSRAFPESNVYLQNIRQAVRVAVDEEGVTAAAFTENIPGSPPPPEEIMDFVLDRPFLFIIERAGVPLFVGVINNPAA